MNELIPNTWPEHDTFSDECWCCPTIEYEGEVRIIIHNSLKEAN